MKKFITFFLIWSWSLKPNNRLVLLGKSVPRSELLTVTGNGAVLLRQNMETSS
jgi:hypothetical protein